jgi:hypothetical protein
MNWSKFWTAQPITDTATAVRELGALPMPVGSEPRTLDVVEEELTGANLSLYEEELENARLRLALASAQRGRRELRARVAELEAQRDRRRDRLVALQNDALNMRGSLSPNGEERRVPFPLGETLTPAVDWLIARVAELEAENRDAVRVSEALNRRLHDEMLAGSALYAALTMPTTPEQLQAALDQFRAVAKRIPADGTEAAS